MGLVLTSLAAPRVHTHPVRDGSSGVRLPVLPSRGGSPLSFLRGSSFARLWLLPVLVRGRSRALTSGHRELPKAARCPVPSERAALHALARVHAAVRDEVASRSVVAPNPGACGTS